MGLANGEDRVEVYHPKFARISRTISHNGNSSLAFNIVDKGYTLVVEVSSVGGNVQAMTFLECVVSDSKGQEMTADGQPMTMLMKGAKIAFKGLSVGEYQISIPNSTVEGITRKVTMGGEEVVTVKLDLVVAGRIDVTIGNPELSALDISQGEISWKDLKTGAVHNKTSFLDAVMSMQMPSKKLSAKGLSAGRWEITIKLDGYREFTQVYEVEAGKTATAEAVLTPE